MLHMEQKDYSMEIILQLLKENNHARELAKKLNINHMMIVRKLKKLQNKNVVDYTQKGKNKVYFLKKTIEAKEHIFMAEKYKLIKILNIYPELRSIINKLQNNKKLKLIVLFGSYAKQLATKNSDIDIFAETTDKSLKKDLNLLDSKLNTKIGKYNTKDLLFKEIDKNHVIIKGAEFYYEKNKFFEKN